MASLALAGQLLSRSRFLNTSKGIHILPEERSEAPRRLMEKYEMGPLIGTGNFGVARVMRNRETGEVVAVKFLQRGPRLDERVGREILNHRSLRHPNIIGFKEVMLTPTHLAIIMEYAAGGDLFEWIRRWGVFNEDSARFFFRQLISGVGYCHSMEICHRDLKLENALLTGTPKRPRLKICDFGYSKSSLLHSKPNSKVGSPSYIAPEIFTCREYDGKAVDIWSCGVCLYVMIIGKYPFEDEADTNNVRKTVDHILQVKYRIPAGISVSQECQHLLARIFVADPTKRITVEEITRHPWFVKELPPEFTVTLPGLEDDLHCKDVSEYGHQSVEEIMRIVKEGGTLAPGVPEDGGLII